jgi:hypothetical protein
MYSILFYSGFGLDIYIEFEDTKGAIRQMDGIIIIESFIETVTY